MPASNERVPNRPLSGDELRKIIVKKVDETLIRDGMFGINIAYSRVSAEVRVSLHLDNPIYPEHVNTVELRPPSKQEAEKNPELLSIEPGGGLKGELSEEEVVYSEETQIQIQSPNMARISNEMPLVIDKKDLDTGRITQVEQMYKGDIPDPETVGNTERHVRTSEDQRAKWNVKKKEKK